MGACRHGTYLRVFKFLTLEEKFHIYKQPPGSHAIFCLLMYINIQMTTFLAIFRRFPNTFRRFPKILQKHNCFRTLSENFWRLPKISLEEPMMFFTSENNIYFSRVKICLRAKAHLVFHWCYVCFSKLTLFSSLSRCALTPFSSTSTLLSFPFSSDTSCSRSESSLLHVSYSCWVASSSDCRLRIVSSRLAT